MEIPRKNRAHFKVARFKVADPGQSSMIGHKISGSPVVLNFQGLMMGGLVAPVGCERPCQSQLRSSEDGLSVVACGRLPAFAKASAGLFDLDQR